MSAGCNQPVHGLGPSSDKLLPFHPPLLGKCVKFTGHSANAANSTWGFLSRRRCRRRFGEGRGQGSTLTPRRAGTQLKRVRTRRARDADKPSVLNSGFLPQPGHVGCYKTFGLDKQCSVVIPGINCTAS